MPHDLHVRRAVGKRESSKAAVDKGHLKRRKIQWRSTVAPACARRGWGSRDAPRGEMGVDVNADSNQKRADGDNVAGSRPWLDLSDAKLLAVCEVDTYRASGPGGQKRNKTSSAVRLRHGPTGLIVIAEESRSQHENRARAVRRLREAIALTQRRPVSPGDPLPEFLRDALARNPGLRVNPRHEDYFRVVQHLLDTLAGTRGSVADTAAALGISTAQIVRFLQCDCKLWAQANHLRAEFGLPPLK